jgi:hypothetical protein
MKIEIIMAVITGLLLFPSFALAYLDPGSGSLIIQGIIGGIAVVAVFVRIYWNRLLVFLGLRKKQNIAVPDNENIEK